MTAVISLYDQTPLEALLLAIAETLDVPPSAYEQATERYEAVGDWLCREGSPLRGLRPTVYPQGSISLGTVVRPLNDGDDYDIDAVVELAGPRDTWVPADLKRAVGERLRQSEGYRPMLEAEGGRCRRPRYAGGAGAHGFHMDLLVWAPPEGLEGVLKKVLGESSTRTTMAKYAAQRAGT